MLINRQNNFKRSFENRIKKYDNIKSKINTNLSLEKKLIIIKGKDNNNHIKG